MSDRKIMLDPADEDSVLRAAAAVNDAIRALNGIDARRYGGPKKKETKLALYEAKAALRHERTALDSLVRDSRALRAEMF